LKKTAMKKVSNDKPFVRSNLIEYKSHITNSIPKLFIRNKWDVNSTMTKYSDYFVKKVMSDP